MNPALTLLFVIIIVMAGVGLVALYGLLTAAKLKAASLREENTELRAALGLSQGYLENVSTSSIPGVSDGAYTVLARIDELTREKK